MYWNTLIAWPFTSYNRDFAEEHPKDWILRDMTTGEPLYKVDRPNFQVSQYNLLNSDVRDWWVDTVSGAVKEFGFDGFFMDAVSQSKRPLWLKKGWGLGKEAEQDAAAVDLMQRTKMAMGPDHDINWLNKEFMQQPAAEKEKLARMKLEYPEYSKKLGTPKGNTISKGWKFKREFEHATVSVDLEKREGRIQWLEN